MAVCMYSTNQKVAFKDFSQVLLSFSQDANLLYHKLLLPINITEKQFFKDIKG